MVVGERAPAVGPRDNGYRFWRDVGAMDIQCAQRGAASSNGWEVGHGIPQF